MPRAKRWILIGVVFTYVAVLLYQNSRPDRMMIMEQIRNRIDAELKSKPDEGHFFSLADFDYGWPRKVHSFSGIPEGTIVYPVRATVRLENFKRSPSVTASRQEFLFFKEFGEWTFVIANRDLR